VHKHERGGKYGISKEEGKKRRVNGAEDNRSEMQWKQKGRIQEMRQDKKAPAEDVNKDAKK